MAPMAGITDRAFREIVGEYGADYTITEMVSAKALYYQDNKTKRLLDRSSGKDTGIQIFGSDPEIISQVIEDKINYMNFDFIDFNMGCPAPKIFNNGEGSYLMKEPDLAYEILSHMVRASNKPVHLKMRLGIGKDSKNFLQIARLAEKAGVSSVCLHARTRSQFYQGKADWTAIKELVDEIGIPVIGNGDIVSGQTAIEMLDYTGCHSIMVGRAALGNPFIFSQIKAELRGQEYKEPSIADLYELIKVHYRKSIEYKGDRAIAEMRKHLSYYLKGYPGSAKVKDRVNKLESLDEIKKTIDEYMDSIR